jgi:hypothetical protein
LSGGGNESNFFFEPVRFHLGLADLLIEFFDEPVLLLVLFVPAFGEDLRGFLKESIFPFRDQERVELVFRRQLRDRTDFGEHFEDDLRFEFGTELSAFFHGR